VWGVGPQPPTPQTPIPNPQSPIIYEFYLKNINIIIKN